MLYLSIALVLCTVILTVKPPTFTFHKIITVEQQDLSTESTTPVDIKKLNEDLPPTLDDLVSTLNESLYDITGGDNIER